MTYEKPTVEDIEGEVETKPGASDNRCPACGGSGFTFDFGIGIDLPGPMTVCVVCGGSGEN